MSYRSISLIALTLTIACTPEQTDIVELPEQDTTNQGSGDTEQIGDGPNTDTEVIEDNEPECSFTMETWDGDVEFANELEWYTSLGTPYGTVEVSAEAEVSRFFLRASHEECGDLMVNAFTLYPAVSDVSDSDWYRNIGEVTLMDVVTGEVLGVSTPSICFEDGCPQNTIHFGEGVDGWDGIYLTAGEYREIGVYVDLIHGRDGETIQVSWAPSQTEVIDIESGEAHVPMHDTMYGNELEIVRDEDLQIDITFTTAWSAAVPFSIEPGQEGANFGAWLFTTDYGVIDIADVSVLSYVDADGDGIFYPNGENGVYAADYLYNCRFTDTLFVTTTIMGPMDIDEYGSLNFSDNFRVMEDDPQSMNLRCDVHPDADELEYAAFAFDIQTGDVHSTASVGWYHSHNVDYVGGDGATTVTLAGYIDN